VRQKGTRNKQAESRTTLLATCSSTCSGILVMMDELKKIQKEPVTTASARDKIQTKQIFAYKS
jgi:hypothetical protein